MFNCPKNAMQAARATAPTRLPANTMPQLRSRRPQVMRPSSAAVIMRALPVNSSVPMRMTIMSPTGKMRPDTRRTMPALSRAWAAVEEVTPPRPMSRPAATAKMKRRHAGDSAFPTDAFM